MPMTKRISNETSVPQPVQYVSFVNPILGFYRFGKSCLIPAIAAVPLKNGGDDSLGGLDRQFGAVPVT
ncbi:hypothetical protein [Candidatus Enterococcus ferrettii]|uniref:Uncharacterized protein n=1 Tax=Candidatus Enterococcus ferrettii TaxID=2815324 RepID=A0ABV0EKW5_9ENTE|nr:hypothetical protein [Enterococcus sp. 665A]MBO1338954.1 hypothetical protein [Enterococcus sp. 665A]